MLNRSSDQDTVRLDCEFVRADKHRFIQGTSKIKEGTMVCILISAQIAKKSYSLRVVWLKDKILDLFYCFIPLQPDVFTESLGYVQARTFYNCSLL